MYPGVRHRQIVIGLLILVVTTILVACGGSQSSGPQAVTITPGSTQPTKDPGLQEYQTTQELADDLTEHGHSCKDLVPIASGRYSVDTAKCVAPPSGWDGF
jgi:ABC-type glycerol-3-phosphate transport system substrate-binding protein